MDDKQAVLVLNGELHDPDFLASFNTPAWLKIAVDGGLHYFHLAEIPPDILIGDLDSISPTERIWAEEQHTRILQYPIAKDETDFELALSFALLEKCAKIRIVAALGGRLDQTLANSFILLDPRLHDLDVRFDDGKEEVCLIRRRQIIDGKPGDIISLIPLQPVVQGVRTHQLAYPLNDEDLYIHQTRGISNVMLSETAEIEIKGGHLLCIHTRQGK
ncbi:MAG: thiamine diphosphokinase [Anaerolineaceae bacterium]|nr:thiamine diphosphokinase [Anaerolineaceae bacterium]